ncbi:MAG: GntR family transcriptional regulator [Rhodocyclaceae bacterium]
MSPPTTLTLLQQHSLPSLVQEELERMILDGRLTPGQALREVALVAQLGVSRGPIREAFRGLEEKGLVRVVKNCGVYVRTLSLDEADQIYEVRIALEGLIGRLLAQAITEAGVAELEGIVDAMEDAAASKDVDRYTSLNLALHDRLAALTGNPKLHDTYGRLVGELSLFRRQAYLHDQHTMGISLREHRAIVRAVAARDARQSADLLCRHAEDSRRRMHGALGDAAKERSSSLMRKERESGQS